MRPGMPLAESHSGLVFALTLEPAARARSPVPGGPCLSQASGALLRKVQILDEYGDHRTIEVPVERPLSIRLDGQNVATLWTLGASAEWLVLGYLWTRQFVTDVTAVEAISINWADGVAEVKSRGDPAPVQRHGVPAWRDFTGRQARYTAAPCSAAPSCGSASRMSAVVTPWIRCADGWRCTAFRVPT